MTKLEAIEKIRKLPELKVRYEYKVDNDSQVWIKDIKEDCLILLFSNFYDIANNQYNSNIESYKKYFAKPIIKQVETIIVGYE